MFLSCKVIWLDSGWNIAGKIVCRFVLCHFPSGESNSFCTSVKPYSRYWHHAFHAAFDGFAWVGHDRHESHCECPLRYSGHMHRPSTVAMSLTRSALR